jgi:hypothetical protein
MLALSNSHYPQPMSHHALSKDKAKKQGRKQGKPRETKSKQEKARGSKKKQKKATKRSEKARESKRFLCFWRVDIHASMLLRRCYQKWSK